MSIFEKGDYQKLPTEFIELGIQLLKTMSEFQDKFEVYDTDTTINSIRDAIVSGYLGYDLLNFEKHGFDAKKSSCEEFLEIKQCSYVSKTWGGTWNDTNEEKANSFVDTRLFTAVAIWKNASDLQCLVYGQSAKLGAHLLKLVQNRRTGSRSTQSISIQKLIKDFGFSSRFPPNKTYEETRKLLIKYNSTLEEYIGEHNVKSL